MKLSERLEHIGRHEDEWGVVEVSAKTVRELRAEAEALEAASPDDLIALLRDVSMARPFVLYASGDMKMRIAETIVALRKQIKGAR